MDNKERNEKIVAMWKDGNLSASQIGDRIGVNRNVVIGVVARAGLMGKKAPRRRTRRQREANAKRRQERAARAGEAQAKRMAIQEAAARQRMVEVGSRATPAGTKPLVDLEPNECRWPYGDGPFTFCGKGKMPGTPYCLGHLGMSREPGTAYRPTVARGRVREMA